MMQLVTSLLLESQKGLRMTAALDDDFDRLTDFGRVKGVGIVVDIGDLLSANSTINAPASPAIGWAIAANSDEFYPEISAV